MTKIYRIKLTELRKLLSEAKLGQFKFVDADDPNRSRKLANRPVMYFSEAPDQDVIDELDRLDKLLNVSIKNPEMHSYRNFGFSSDRFSAIRNIAKKRGIKWR